MKNWRADRFLQKILVLVVISSGLWGCSTMAVNNSTAIGTNANGFARGEYSDSRSGVLYSPTLGFVGGGGGGGGIGGVGLGAGWAGFQTGNVQSEGDPMKFARAIALINYTKNLSKDDSCGSRENVFSNRPIKQKDYQPFGSQVE